MKFTAIILLSACMAASAKGFTQTVTLSEKNAPLEKVFKEIKRQTGYDFIYENKVLGRAKKVDIQVKSATLEQVLEICFRDQPLTWSIVGRIIVVKEKEKTTGLSTTIEPDLPLIDISGKVTDADDNPLQGANVKVKGTDKGTTTNSEGVFILKGVDADATLEISYIGYQTIAVAVSNRSSISASLQLNVITNPEVIVRKGYYNERRTTTTGNVGTITSKDIEKQPVSNALMAMQARIPGVVVTQSTGLPGSGVQVQIRGRNSLAKGNEALYIIDGVPYPSLNLPSINDMMVLGTSNNSAGSGVASAGSPFSYINPADIESIDILKDADATAIYGSRGANGVVLITTKRGKPGQARVNVNIQTGIGQVARKLDVLDRQQYLDMRYEAFKNDAAVPNPNIDYDLTLWDTTRFTDWQKELIGNTAHYNDAQASISGGSANTQFLFGVGYHKETTVFPGDFNDQKGSAHFNINNLSPNKKFSFLVTGMYTVDNNHLPAADLTEPAIKLAPIAPALYKNDGSINWAPNTNGVATWRNPVSMLQNRFNIKTNNLASNANITYQVLEGLEIKSSFGFSNLQTDEVQTVPLSSSDPSIWNTIQRSSKFSNNRIQSWIVEPQASYSKDVFNGELSLMAGGTIQQTSTNQQAFNAEGFNSDLVMEDIRSATSVTVISSINSLYKYAAFFGRLNYNWKDKYIMNLTGRRDGTSRFGPANRYHNFGAAGIGWVFSKEKLVRDFFPALSFGKLRGSYGTTGSDQVGDYTYMDLYVSGATGVPYQGVQSAGPTRIFTPDLEWEETRKLEGGIELGFFHDRIVAKASYYRNRSYNQLLDFPLPAISGFTSVQRNLYALVQNKGWEFELNTLNVDGKKLQWSSSFNLTLNRNKLLSAPDGVGAYYQNMVGHSIISLRVNRFIGVNFINGKYEVADNHGSPILRPDPARDRYFVDIVPKFHGGLQNSFSYGDFQLDFLFHFVRQPLAPIYLYNFIPGFFNSETGNNQPVTVLNRWQTSGDIKPIQKFSQNSSLVTPFINALQSDQLFGDGSYIRLKNVSLSWQLPKPWKQKLHLQNTRIYVQGQNLLTITNYQGLDPETINSTTLPPLRVITAGVQISL